MSRKCEQDNENEVIRQIIESVQLLCFTEASHADVSAGDEDVCRKRPARTETTTQVTDTT